MKFSFILGLVLSTSITQAQDLCKQNSLEILSKKINETGLLDIYRENRSTLLKMEVGMKAIVDIESLELYRPTPDNIVSVEKKSRLKKTILRIEGTKAYILWEEEDFVTGEKSRYVFLEQMDMTKSPPVNIDDIKYELKGNELTIFHHEYDESDGFIEEMSGKTLIDLKQPEFCSGQYSSDGFHTDLRLNKKVRISHHSRTRCIENESKSNLLKLDLSSIEFCDIASNPQSFNCEQTNLSFITQQMTEIN